MSLILEVKDLTIRIGNEILVNRVSFSLRVGQCVGILGESGSGKSTICKALMGLLDDTFTVSGKVFYKGENLLAVSKKEWERLRGDQLCMIMQNPVTSFDPLYRIEKQMMETLDVHTTFSLKEKRQTCMNTLKAMQIRQPEEVLKKYPHQLSGGTLQRIMIGMALMMNPHLILADEPTTAIDSMIQYEIIKEFQQIKASKVGGMIFVSHDLGVISKLADEVLVMHKGQVVQQGKLTEILKSPKGKYTQALVENKLKVMRRFDEVMQSKQGGSM